MSQIKIETSDHKIFDIDMEVGKMSMTIKSMLEKLTNTNEDARKPIFLSNVHSTTMEKILKWIEYHKNDPLLPDDGCCGKSADDICKWDQEFLKVDRETLFQITFVAEFLQIKCLLRSCGQTVANLIKACKTPEEICAFLGLRTSFENEEISGNVHTNEQIRSKN